MSYTVIVCDMFHVGDDPDHEVEVPGFPTRELAIEYARRRLRKSLEEQRESAESLERLRERWHAFGEDCRVAGPEGVVYRASAELDRFMRQPATPDECDYLSLYESLLPEDFTLRCEWAAGAVPPPHHHEYRIVLNRTEQAPCTVQTDEVPSHPRVRGELTFRPDYPGPDVPEWSRSFVASTRECLRVLALVRDGGLLNAVPPVGEEDSPVGGETVALDVTAGGASRRIRSTDLPPELRAFLLGEVMEAIRGTVPFSIWEEMHARRHAHHHDREPRG